MILSNIGRIHEHLGQNQKALEFHQKALSISQEIEDRVGEVTTLNGIALVYDYLGKKYKALEIYQNILLISQAIGHRDIEATVLNNIGRVYNDLGQNQKAITFYQKALPVFQEIESRIGEATTFNNIGVVYSTIGQQQKALEYFQKALPIDQVLGDRAGEAKTLNNLMSYWEKLKNTPFSIFYGKQSVNARQNIRANISKMDRTIKKSYYEKTKQTYRRLAGYLVDESRIPEAQHVLDMLKEKEYFEFTGNRLDPPTLTYSLLDFSKFEKQWIDKIKKISKDYGSTTADYSLQKKKELKTEGEKKQLKKLEVSLKQYRKDYDRYFTELKGAFDKYNSSVKKETIKTSNSQKLLRERQATLRKLDESEGGKNVFLHFLVQDERIAIIFTTPESQFVRFSNVSKKKLNWLILEYWDAIEKRKKASQKGINNDSINETIYGKLYDQIFKPVDMELKKYGATNLMVYLDGLLRYIPLPVLWDGENYLVQRYRIALFTSASFARIQREPGVNNKMLGLGASSGGEGFEPLPNVKDEIHGIIKDNENGFNGVIPGKAFLDNDFTKETFINQLQTADYPLVHISSHFAFNTGDETKNHLLMGDGSLMNLQEIREKGNLFTRSSC